MFDIIFGVLPHDHVHVIQQDLIYNCPLLKYKLQETNNLSLALNMRSLKMQSSNSLI